MNELNTENISPKQEEKQRMDTPKKTRKTVRLYLLVQ